jgi:hypothetical protein
VAVDVLATNLHGLGEAADFHSADLRDDFYELWTRIDMEAETRTEGWAPPGPASDAALMEYLDALLAWVEARLADRNYERA